MDTLLAISIVMGLVLAGSLGSIVVSMTNCNQLQDVNYCKQSQTFGICAGQAVAISGLVFGLLIIKSNRTSKQPTSMNG